MIYLLIVGQKEERPIAYKGAAEGGSELVLGKVRCKSGAAPARKGVARVCRERVVFAEVVRRAMELVGARFGNDVDEAAARTTELGVCPISHHHEVLYGIEIEGESGPLAPALLAEEWIVEVCAIHRDVVVDA